MEDNEMPQETPTLEEVKSMAITEDWDGVDSVMSSVANDPDFLRWAESGLDDEDGNLRDLAASLFEKTSVDLAPTVIETLLRHVKRDDNPYASFRSAFALYRAGYRNPEVIKRLKEALDDEDVREIAEHYLKDE